MGLPVRTRLATSAGRMVAAASRRLQRGSGSTIGGRVALAIDRDALGRLAAGHDVVLVTGTNGKTTTTRLVAAALATQGPVASSAEGANLLPGLVTALSVLTVPAQAALEVDEALLGRAAEASHPAVMVLLNLSRDQLDRIGEVRRHAGSWRATIEEHPGTQVVANADDPLVVWAAADAHLVTWVGTGQRWREDSATCPACGSRIEWSNPVGGSVDGSASVPDGDPGTPWRCAGCPLARPQTAVWVLGKQVVTASGERAQLDLLLPGRVNRGNAAMAAAAAAALGVGLAEAVGAMAVVGSVAGRYDVITTPEARVRLLLAKNPAGWAEALDLVRPAPIPVVVGINARTADGFDPSWLWDVPFERLAGRTVVATGERGRDLAVRLRYADVPHVWAATWPEAVAAAAQAAQANGAVRSSADPNGDVVADAGDGTSAPNVLDGGGADGMVEIDLAANYTAFQDARKALSRGGS